MAIYFNGRLRRFSHQRVTFAELQEWPGEGRRYELYDGEVVVVPMPFLRHQRVAFHIGEVLRDYEQREGGLVSCVPLDIVFSERDVVQSPTLPNLSFPADRVFVE